MTLCDRLLHCGVYPEPAEGLLAMTAKYFSVLAAILHTCCWVLHFKNRLLFYLKEWFSEDLPTLFEHFQLQFKFVKASIQLTQ
jgi:hypothetical protein